MRQEMLITFDFLLHAVCRSDLVSPVFKLQHSFE